MPVLDCYTPHFTPDPRASDALDFLAGLGSAERIRLHLRNTGITGKIGDSRDCMIARHLRAVVGDENLAVMGSAVLSISADAQPDFCVTVSRHYTPLPEVVREFIGNFDHGNYPELIADDSRKPVDVCWCTSCLSKKLGEHVDKYILSSITTPELVSA